MRTSSTSNTMSSHSGRKCPRCGKNSILLDGSTGEKFCSFCGYVISENAGQESSSHGLSNDSPNVSSSMSEIGSAVINPKDKDASGKPVSTSMTSSINRLKKLDSKTKTHSSTEKNLKQAQIEIDKLKDKLALSEAVIEKTKSIYKKAIERKLTRGYSIKGLIGACLYASCKNSEIARTMKDISDVIDIKKKDISRCYKLIVNELELKITVLDPKIHVPRIASMIGISEKSKRKAITILEQAKKERLDVGKEPMSVIAGALYLACIRTNEGKTQKEIANASKVTEKVIRTRCKELSQIA